MSKNVNKDGLSHDQLQAKCFQWAWNNYPQFRGLFWSNNNNAPMLSGQALKIALSRLKALGLVQGVADMSLVGLDGKFNAVEFKAGADKQSESQILHEMRLNETSASYTIISDVHYFRQYFCNLYQIKDTEK